VVGGRPERAACPDFLSYSKEPGTVFCFHGWPFLSDVALAVGRLFVLAACRLLPVLAAACPASYLHGHVRCPLRGLPLAWPSSCVACLLPVRPAAYSAALPEFVCVLAGTQLRFIDAVSTLVAPVAVGRMPLGTIYRSPADNYVRSTCLGLASEMCDGVACLGLVCARLWFACRRLRSFVLTGPTLLDLDPPLVCIAACLLDAATANFHLQGLLQRRWPLAPPVPPRRGPRVRHCALPPRHLGHCALFL